MSMASVTDFTDGELVDELQDRGFTVTWGRDAEIAELRQQLAAAQSEIESAFREGFRSPATYNDILVNDEDEEWEKYKRRMK